MISKIYFELKEDGEPNYRCICRTPELIENYDKAITDKNNIWVCHHRQELVITGADVDRTRQELIDLGMYFDVDPSELIFLTRSEHMSLHSLGNQYCKGKHHSEESKKKTSESMKGKKWSEESRIRFSESLKGEKNHWFGKKHSNETKEKMSESMKGLKKGKHWKLINGKRVWY